MIENRQLGQLLLPAERDKEVLEGVGLLENVLKLPDGMHTRLATGGAPLSAGQAIQLELARALGHEPRLLVLDGCLDWLQDLPGRERLLDLIFRSSGRWAVIAASHNEDILQRCDRIFETGNGSLREVRG